MAKAMAKEMARELMRGAMIKETVKETMKEMTKKGCEEDESRRCGNPRQVGRSSPREYCPRQ